MMQLFRSVQLTPFLVSSTFSRSFSLHLTLKRLHPREESRFINSSRTRNFITWPNNHLSKSNFNSRPGQVYYSSRYYSFIPTQLLGSTTIMTPTISPSSTNGDINNNTMSKSDPKCIARSLKTSVANLGSKELLNLPSIPPKEIKFPVSWGHIAAQVGYCLSRKHEVTVILIASFFRNGVIQVVFQFSPFMVGWTIQVLLNQLSHIYLPHITYI